MINISFTHGGDFDKEVNAYEYYANSHELGRYAAYYIAQ